MKKLFLLLAAGLAIAAGCGRGGAPAGFSMPPPAVTVSAAVSRDVPLYVDEIGTCTARQYVSITPQVTGPILGIHFKDGADVRKGDPLFTIDPRPFQAALDQARAEQRQAQANVEFSKIEFARMDELLKTKAVSQDDFDTKKNAYDVAEAQLANSIAAVETSKLNLEYCSINSPVDGRAGQRLVDPGNVVTANQTSLLVIQTTDPIYADFTIPEDMLPSVRQHDAEGTLKVLVRLPSDEGDGKAGDLTYIDTGVQDQSGTVKLRATLPNADRHFWPGQFVDVRLILTVEKDAVLVPAVAQQIGQSGSFVYVVKNNSTAEMRPVTIGQRQGDMFVIEKGVSAGENVVTTGQMLVTPGGAVRIMAAGPTTGPTTEATTEPTTGPSQADAGGAGAVKS
jgi:membrane fusion protein, multidrug efflux system